MNEIFSKEAVLLLKDGTIYRGKARGKIGTAGGEICFNTGMTGYQEIYTDPSYFGQIIVNTTTHIGNYGAKNEEQESGTPKIAGIVVNDFSETYSRSTASESLQKYLYKNNVVGITEIDTRALVRHIRDKGAMNAIISSENLDLDFLREALKKVPDMSGLELATKVSTAEPYFYGDENSPNKVAVLDLGIKSSILKNLASRGCYCKVFPAQTSFKEMKAWGPDGFFISNGPGDPAAMKYAIDTVKDILKEDSPMFGICLGHQVIALANGIPTYKMHHGHRGLNHPVKNLETGRSEVTSQNHGFVVDKANLEKNPNVVMTHIHLNDGTLAGLKLKNKKTFSVQYHPEASPGPHDSRYLFDNFIKYMNNK
ncbi:MAG: glutamine-hydrolyzing carbamoyl-phosphate synthase small subunit [Anaerolineales bacterium]